MFCNQVDENRERKSTFYFNQHFRLLAVKFMGWEQNFKFGLVFEVEGHLIIQGFQASVNFFIAF